MRIGITYEFIVPSGFLKSALGEFEMEVLRSFQRRLTDKWKPTKLNTHVVLKVMEFQCVTKLGVQVLKNNTNKFYLNSCDENDGVIM